MPEVTHLDLFWCDKCIAVYKGDKNTCGHSLTYTGWTEF